MEASALPTEPQPLPRSDYFDLTYQGQLDGQMEISEVKSITLTVVTIVACVVFLTGVVASLKLSRHHHALLLLVALGLNGAVWAQGLTDSGSSFTF